MDMEGGRGKGEVEHLRTRTYRKLTVWSSIKATCSRRTDDGGQNTRMYVTLLARFLCPPILWHPDVRITEQLYGQDVRENPSKCIAHLQRGPFWLTIFRSKYRRHGSGQAPCQSYQRSSGLRVPPESKSGQVTSRRS